MLSLRNVCLFACPVGCGRLIPVPPRVRHVEACRPIWRHLETCTLCLLFHLTYQASPHRVQCLCSPHYMLLIQLLESTKLLHKYCPSQDLLPPLHLQLVVWHHMCSASSGYEIRKGEHFLFPENKSPQASPFRWVMIPTKYNFPYDLRMSQLLMSFFQCDYLHLKYKADSFSIFNI